MKGGLGDGLLVCPWPLEKEIPGPHTIMSRILTYIYHKNQPNGYY